MAKSSPQTGRSNATASSHGVFEDELAMFDSDKPNKEKKRRGFFGHLFRVLLWLLLILFIVLLLVLAGAGFVAGTDKGFNLALLQVTERVEGLRIESPSGNLNKGISADAIAYRNDTIAINLTGLESQWQTGCLTRKEFCLDRLIIDEMRVESLVDAEPSTDEKRTTAIELPAINLPLDVAIDDVQIGKFIFKPFGEAPEQVVTDIHLQAQNIGNKISIRTLSANHQNFSATASGEVTLEGDYPLDLLINATGDDILKVQEDEHEEVQEEVQEKEEEKKQEKKHDGKHTVALSLKATESLANLTINGDVTGAVNANIRGQIQALEPTVPLELSITSDEAGWPLASHEIAKATDLALDIKGDLDDFNITLNTDLSGEQIPDTTIALSAVANPLRVLVPDVSVQTLDGFLTGNAALSLGDQISWVSDLVVKDINPQSLLPAEQQDFKGTINARISADGGVHDGQWMLNLTRGDIDGEIRGIPFTLSTKLFKTYDDRWRVKQLVLDNGDNRINAAGTAGNTLDIDADISLTQLQNFLPGLAGGFEADLRVTGKPTTPSVVLDAKSSVLKYEDILITGLSLGASIDQLFDNESAIRLSIERVQKDRTEVLGTMLDVAGTRREHRIEFSADGPEATALSIATTGALSDSFDWLGDMQSALIEVPAHKITLAEPFELGWNNAIKKARIGAHCWQTEETSLCLKNEVLAEPTGTAAVELARYPLARLDPFLPAGSELQGELGADATIVWGEDQPGGYNATLNAKVANGGVQVVDDAFDELSFTYDTFVINGKANGESVNAEIMLDSQSLGKAEANVTLDPATEGQPITGDINLTGFDIGFLKAFLPDIDEVSGEISTDGKLSGSLTDPRFNGQVVLDKPIVRAETLPVSIDGGRITANVNGKRANITGNLDSGDGTVGLSGTADWNQLDAWRANILVEADRLNVQSDPVTESDINADIRITASPANLNVNGDVSIPMARIVVEEIAQGATSLSEDVIIIEDEAAKAAEEQAASNQPASEVNVAVNVSLGDDISVEAFGLKAQLKGDMSVAVQPPRPPELAGEVRIVEGIFKQYGQDLTVTDGQILFVGPVDQTRLDMDAVRTIEGEDRVAGLRVQGPLAEPGVTLFTEPADKEQDSILSYIVLGRDINETTDTEQNLLATAALALTLRGGRGTATEFAESLGIKEFALDARGRGDETEVVVSGKLSDNLLVRYGQSVFTNTNTLYLRYDITRKLYLEAASGLSKAVDLVYSFSF